MSNQASQRQCMNSRLNNDLLFVIFYRLPNFESVVLCKSVCKLWLNLISEPGFVSQFIAHKINSHHSSKSSNYNKSGKDELQHEQQLPHVFWFDHHLPLIYPTLPSLPSLDSLLSFVPTYLGAPLCIKAWCNDLVLCTTIFVKEVGLYICNPRTQQYIQLPAPSCRNNHCVFGFTCDPYYNLDTEANRVALKTEYRYIICFAVADAFLSTRLTVEIFSSGTRVWRKVVLETPVEHDYAAVNLFQTSVRLGFGFAAANKYNSFTYRGMLHFYGPSAIIGFDPYKINEDGVINGHIIHLPRILPPFPTDTDFTPVSLGVFEGKLHVAKCYEGRFRIETLPLKTKTVYCVMVWELKEYDTSEWIKKHMIYLHNLDLEDLETAEQIKKGCQNSQRIHFYPNNADIVLLKIQEQTLECNLKRKTLKKFCAFDHQLNKASSLGFPWWPTPLPRNVM